MRLPRWEMALDAFVLERQAEPFAWGTNDCAMFASEWVKRCTGNALFAATYTDADGAAHELASRGGMAEASKAILGDPLPNPKTAQRGDVGLVDLEGRVSLVVVIGHLAVGPGEKGLHAVPVSNLKLAWRV